MPNTPIRILAVHGVGRHPVGGAWEHKWTSALQTAFAAADPDAAIEVEFAYMDDIFASHKIGFDESFEAIGRLTASLVTAPFRTPRGLGGNLRWTAGMVVQWVANEELRRQTRQKLARYVREFKPDAIIAHSLGSLVAYDTFTEPRTRGLIDGRIFVSFGSQIGNPFVTGNFGAGRIVPLESARHWYHLFNAEDAVFTCPINLAADNYTQVDTFFDIKGVKDHDAPEYIGHLAAVDQVWGRMTLERTRPALFRAPRRAAVTPTWSRSPQRRALLIGINDYPAESMRLRGCVNDVYLFSSLLQESGFDAEDIRVVLNDRATAAGIRERMHWLLEDVTDGQERVLYYSGHGAQMPSYGLGDRVDRMDESLVPHDFDWSPEHAFTDDQFYQLYSQLPYDSRFLAVFDCCHSGGLTRAGAPRIRGINPPDDVRHRALRWNAEHGMWVPRQFQPESDARSAGKKAAAKKGAQQSAAAKSRRTPHSAPPKSTHRLGHFRALRQLSDAAFDKRREVLGHHGPYMPVLLYACREDQYSFEYEHGSISYGAFTFCLAKNLRSAARKTGPRITFKALCGAVCDELAGLGYDQQPNVEGPAAGTESPIPFGAPPKPKRKPRKRGK